MTAAVVLENVLVERMLPAAAKLFTVNESVPLKLPLPAVTVATFVFDETAESACQADALLSASVAVDNVVKPLCSSP